MAQVATSMPLPDGTVYSPRKNFTPFSTSPIEAYRPIIGDAVMERLYKAADKVKGMSLLELNATAQGGGVAEILYGVIPFWNELGIQAEWKVIGGNELFFECTKALHNLIQGKPGTLSEQMQDVYRETIGKCAAGPIVDYTPDVVLVHDPQPLGLVHYLKKPEETWIWRCHIDIEEAALRSNPGLWEFLTGYTKHYDAAVFSAAHYVVSRWNLPKFIVPPYIDPLSEKNRDLTEQEIDAVLAKYELERGIPMITQIGRFDPWKGLDRTVAAYRLARKQLRCQLVLAGGFASDDPEGGRMLAELREQTKHDEDVRVLHLPLENRLENWREVNALQRAASVIMAPSTREGFGLVITEGMWKARPVIAGDVGAIPLQIWDGDTGFFYTTPQETAEKIVSLVQNPSLAEQVGMRAKQYVTEHFLLPVRATDWLLIFETLLHVAHETKLPDDSIISYHPWYKLNKRR